jgi:outer membrane immunogenic protein
MHHVRFAVLAAFVGFASVASAADLPVKAPVAIPYSWTGFYVGANAGVMSDKTDGFFTNFPTHFWRTDQVTGVGGIHGGYQYQFGNAVVGVEAGWSSQLGKSFGSKAGGGEGAPCGVDPPSSCQARIANILQVGPRLGWAIDRWMVFGTGGYAHAAVQTRTFNPDDSEFTFTHGDNRHNGWFAGGGLEYLVTNNFILGADYKHYEFRSKSYTDSVFGDFDRTLKASADTVTARVTIKTSL